MATVFVYLESLADTPLTGASPTLDYWDKSSPGAPVATGVAMTELVGGIGGCYFADVATVDLREYVGIVDSTAAAKIGGRYQMVVFSGTYDARIETDIPAIPTNVWALDISANTNKLTEAGGMLNLIRKATTNRYRLTPGAINGTFELFDDNDTTVVLQQLIFDAVGGGIASPVNSPATRNLNTV